MVGPIGLDSRRIAQRYLFIYLYMQSPQRHMRNFH